MDLISILMPVHNVEKYLDKALNSIINQTWKNFELIIVDDASTDGTKKIVEKYASKDKRIIFLKNNKNEKICFSLNRAFEMSKGNYIARMDGDDISAENRLEVLYNYLVNNEQCMLVGSQITSIDETGMVISEKKYMQSSAYINFFLKYMSCVPHFWMARRKIYEILGGYRNVPYVEDYDFLLRGKLKGFTYANTEQSLYYMRIRQGNTGFTNGLKQQKAVKVIKKIHKIERLNNKELTEYYDMYQNAISNSTSLEENKYINAYNKLNLAIHNRDKKLVMIINLFGAFLGSKYMRTYLIDTTIIRCGIILEKHLKR